MISGYTKISTKDLTTHEGGPPSQDTIILIPPRLKLLSTTSQSSTLSGTLAKTTPSMRLSKRILQQGEVIHLKGPRITGNSTTFARQCPIINTWHEREAHWSDLPQGKVIYGVWCHVTPNPAYRCDPPEPRPGNW
jgi:hypothetical protein